MRDSSQPMSDAPDGQTSDSRVDNINVDTTAGRVKRSLLAGLAVGGTLLGGSLAAAVAVPTLKHQHNKILAQRDEALNYVRGYEAILQNRSSLDAWVDAQVAADPFWDDVDGSTEDHPSDEAARSTGLIGYASCSAPEFEAFVPPSGDDTLDIGQFVAAGPLFRGGLPRPGDLALALANEPHFNDDGVLALVESLVSMRPEFLASNFRVDGSLSNDTRLYAARLFRRETPLSHPQQAWVSTQARSHVALNADVPVWPLVAQAGWHAANSWSLSQAEGDGDYFDNSVLNRHFATLISGSSMNAVALNRWVIDGIAPDSTNASAVADATAAFADKDDNIPFLIEMLRVNPLVFGTVGFNLDSFALLPNATATLKDGGVVRRPDDQQLSFEPVGKPSWTVETAGNWNLRYSEYAIVSTGRDGLSLRRAVDGPDRANRFLTYEAMIYAAAKLNIGRIHCTDSKLLIAQS